MPSPKKRSDEKVGRPHTAKDAVPTTDVLDPKRVTIPEPNEAWCSAAVQLWDAMLESPQAVYFTSADWATAYFAMDALSDCVAHGYSAMKLSAVDGMLRRLLLTETDRRQARIEIKRAQADTSAAKAKVAQMDAYRRAAYGA